MNTETDKPKKKEAAFIFPPKRVGDVHSLIEGMYKPTEKQTQGNVYPLVNPPDDIDKNISNFTD